MEKKNLGKILNQAFETAGAGGIIPSEVLEENNDWEQVRRTLLQWEGKGKITCIQKRNPSNFSRYVLTKYLKEEVIY